MKINWIFLSINVKLTLEMNWHPAVINIIKGNYIKKWRQWYSMEYEIPPLRQHFYLGLILIKCNKKNPEKCDYSSIDFNQRKCLVNTHRIKYKQKKKRWLFIWFFFSEIEEKNSRNLMQCINAIWNVTPV